MVRAGSLDVPRFSIIITCHNQSAYIRDAVNSAFEQTYQDKEIVVVDDASSDASPQTLKEYGDKIRLVTFETNQGCVNSRNAGAAMATGQYFVFLDGDDALLPWALDVYDRIVNTKEPQIILSRMQWFRNSVQEVPTDDTPRQVEFVEYGCLIERDRRYQAGGSAIVVSREVFQKVNGWTDRFFPFEDIDMLMKLGTSGPVVQILAPSTKCYRIHASNVRHQVPMMVKGLYKVIEREKLGEYPGGPNARMERYAVLGAPVYFWIKSAWKAGLYGTAMGVVGRGWVMFLAACFKKIRTKVRGLEKTQVLSMELRAKGTSADVLPSLNTIPSSRR